MRTVGLFLLLFGLFALLHTPSKPPVRSVASTTIVKRPLTPQQLNDQTLEAVIRLWQKRMDGIKAVKIRYEMIDQEAGEEQRTHLVEAQYQRPGQATYYSIDKERPANQRKWRHFVMNEREFFDLDYDSKTIRPSPFSEVGPLQSEFLTGLRSIVSCTLYPLQLNPTMLHQDYRLSINIADLQRYNDNFIHLLVEPKSPKDSRYFTKAEIVLWINKTNPQYADRWMLPARIWIQKANRDQIIWDVKSIKCVDSISKETFEASLPGPGWKWEENNVTKRK
jgi:hypothetical protein